MQGKVGLKRANGEIFIYAYDPAKAKMVHTGNVIDTTYRRTANKQAFMRVVSGWGIQLEVFEKLAELGVTHIEIKDTDNNATWITTYNTYRKHSKTADYGNGKQVFLSLKYYELKGKKPLQTGKLSVFEALMKAPKEKIKEMQQSLFGA